MSDVTSEGGFSRDRASEVHHHHQPAAAAAKIDDEEHPQQPAPVAPYSQSFFSPAIAKERALYFKVLGAVCVLGCIAVWALFAIYWGSLWKQYDLSTNLDAWVLDRDGGRIGSALSTALLNSNNGPKPHPTWRTVTAAQYPTQADVDYVVAVDEKPWIVVEIAQGATAALEAARASGNASWNPNSVVSLVYSEARNQQAVGGLILNAARGALTPAIASLSSQLAAEYLPTIAGNQSAVQALAAAPQTIASPIGMTMRNLRPWNQPVAIAPTFVGLIYLVILAFNITMAGLGARMQTQIGRKLKLSHWIAARILIPIVLYFPLSMMLTLLNVPFKLSYGGMGYGYGAGFMTYFCATWVAMMVLGLWTEAVLSLVTQKFIGFALIAIIILNVSVANVPIETQVSLYRLGYALPFYNVKQIYLTVVFNTGRHILILKHIGILLAWLAVLCLTFPIWIWLERRSERKAGPPPAPPVEKKTDEEA